MDDELVKRLRYAAQLADKGLIIAPSVCHEAAGAIEELQGQHYLMKKTAEWLAEKVPRWIPVTERLPEEYVNVLCHLQSLDRQSEYYSIDHLMEDGQWWKAANSWKHEVTHWMPLPEPPELPKEET